ncbi:MAG: hypothetical protein ACOY90_05280 [Candidatus Zhuqueibacterota bacterium]
MKKFIFYFALILSFGYSAPGAAQQVRALFEQLARTDVTQDVYTRLNLCKKIIEICENAPEPECWFSNLMRDVYRFKGNTEFEIYKKELVFTRLTDAINSLTTSYHFYKDPEVEFQLGYLKAVSGLLEKGPRNLNGLVLCWEAILDIYARDNWTISPPLISKTKQFIEVAQRYATPVTNNNYSGAFARYIIVLACDLMEKGNLSHANHTYFRDTRLKFSSQEGAQWQEWRDTSSSK